MTREPSIDFDERFPNQQRAVSWEECVSNTLRLGESDRMRTIARIVTEVADTDATVLIRGECGVGKDHVARTIHAVSSRRERPFVKVNCAAIPVELLESELFGHERGAFTGAHCRKPGQFEQADGGTIFLDEVAELPLALQAKLLHVVQDLRFSRLGSCGLVDVDTRVIAATNQNLENAMARGEFRPDLYYRLNVVEITVPPLRERPEEIPALASRFLARFNTQYGRAKTISSAGMAHLVQYSWPGNVRELENVMRRLVVLEGEQAIDALTSARGKLGTPFRPFTAESLREAARRGAQEAACRALREVLEGVGWNRAEAARILKISYKTLLNKISECRLEPLSRG
jgi:two-component system, NtrC family, response regulator AtoC